MAGTHLYQHCHAARPLQSRRWRRCSVPPARFRPQPATGVGPRGAQEHDTRCCPHEARRHRSQQMVQTRASLWKMMVSATQTPASPRLNSRCCMRMCMRTHVCARGRGMLVQPVLLGSPLHAMQVRGSHRRWHLLASRIRNRLVPRHHGVVGTIKEAIVHGMGQWVWSPFPQKRCVWLRLPLGPSCSRSTPSPLSALVWVLMAASRNMPPPSRTAAYMHALLRCLH